jgi:hypothetical protein
MKTRFGVFLDDPTGSSILIFAAGQETRHVTEGPRASSHINININETAHIGIRHSL